MEPNKIETHIRETLEKRTIQPSKNAWHQLESKLNSAPNKKKHNSFFWMGIAASIVGVLLLVSQYFNSSTKVINAPVIVDNPKTVKQTPTIQVAVKKTYDTKQDNASKKLDSTVNPAAITKMQTFKIPPKEQRPMASSGKVVPNNEIVPKAPKINHIGSKQNSSNFEDEKIQDVIAQVQSLKDQNQIVTDDEIDLLLKQAQKDIRQHQLYDENTGVVDAQLLLQDVETDLDQSFREKAFKVLKANFNFIKTAVANRNN